jgi:hypothetical protein
VRLGLWQQVLAVCLLVLIVLLLFAAVTTSWSPSSGESYCQSYYSAENETGKKQPSDFWEATFCEPVSFFTAVIMAFTGILAVVAILQTLSLHASNQLARRTATTLESTSQAELRAYVGIEEASIKDFTHGKTPRVQFKIKNFGQTPAYDVTIWNDFKLMRMTDAMFAPCAVRPTHAPNPGQWYFVDSRADDPLTGDDIINFEHELARLYLYGEIRYADAFGRGQTTAFRLEYGKRHTIAGKGMGLSDEGNHAT